MDFASPVRSHDSSRAPSRGEMDAPASSRLDHEELSSRLVVISGERTSSLGSEESVLAKVKGTLTGFFTWAGSFFTEKAAARYALGKPTAELTSAIKFIQEVNARLEGTPFEKVTFKNLPEYIQALKEGKVLYKKTETVGEELDAEEVTTVVAVDPTAALQGKDVQEEVTWGEALSLFNLSNLKKDLKEIARNNAAAVMGKTDIKGMYQAERKSMTDVLETAQKTINVWQQNILKAGKGLSDAEFRGLVQASTDAVVEADSGIDRTYLQQNTAKLWADQMIERFTSEFAASVAPTMTDFDGKVDFAKAGLSKIEENTKRAELIEEFKAANADAEPVGEDLARIERAVVEHMSKDTVKTQIQQQAWNDVMEIQEETLAGKLPEIEARAREHAMFTGMDYESSKAKILGQLQVTPEFVSARAEMAEAVKKVAESQRTFSTVAKDALAGLRSFHTAILMAGKGTGETTGLAEDAVALDFRNANRGLATLTDVYRADHSNGAPAITAEDVLTRARDADSNIKGSRALSATVLEGHEKAVRAAEAVAVQAERTLEALNAFNVDQTSDLEVEKDAIENPVVSREISEELLEEISALLDTTSDGESVSSPTLLRQLLLTIQREEGGLTNVLGIDNGTDIRAMFEAGQELNAEQVGLEEDGEVLYNFAPGAKDALAHMVSDRRDAIQAERQRKVEAEAAARLLEQQALLASSPDLDPARVEVSREAQRGAVRRFFSGIGRGIASAFESYGRTTPQYHMMMAKERDRSGSASPVGLPRDEDLFAAEDLVDSRFVPRPRSRSASVTDLRAPSLTSPRGLPRSPSMTALGGVVEAEHFAAPRRVGTSSPVPGTGDVTVVVGEEI